MGNRVGQRIKNKERSDRVTKTATLKNSPAPAAAAAAAAARWQQETKQGNSAHAGEGATPRACVRGERY